MAPGLLPDGLNGAAVDKGTDKVLMQLSGKALEAADSGIAACAGLLIGDLRQQQAGNQSNADPKGTFPRMPNGRPTPEAHDHSLGPMYDVFVCSVAVRLMDRIPDIEQL